MDRKTQSEIAMLVERYVADLRIFSVKKESTIAYCRSCLMHLLCYMEQGNGRNLSDFDMQEFYCFLCNEKSTKKGNRLKASTKKNIVCQVTLFIRWYQQKYMDRQCQADCDMPRALIGTKQEYRTDTLSDDVLSQIRDALRGETDLIVKAGVVMLLCTGITVREFVQLKSECLSEKEGLDYLSVGNRELPVPKHVGKMIRKQQNIQQGLCAQAVEADKERLWLYPSGNQIHCLTIPMWEYRLRRFAKAHEIRDEAGAPVMLTAAMLRATFVYSLVEAQVPSVVMQYLLGHRYPESTQRQIRRFEDLVSVNALMNEREGIA